jgi:hypothetical protein
MNKPKNMPPYPTPQKVAKTINNRKKELVNDIHHMEQALIHSSENFKIFPKLVRARLELKELHIKMDTWAFKHYSKQ